MNKTFRAAAVLLGIALVSGAADAQAQSYSYASHWKVRSGLFEFIPNWAGAIDPYVVPADSGEWEHFGAENRWSVASKVLWERGLWATRMPNNQFFSIDQYAVSCNPEVPLNGLYVPRSRTGEWVTTCAVTEAPIVDMAWIAANLEGKNYLYVINYPLKDFGNGHAHVNWVKSCHNDIGQPYQQAFCYRGMARVKDAGWKNQFVPISGHVGETWMPGERPPIPAYDFSYEYGGGDATRVLRTRSPAQRDVSVYNFAWLTGAQPGNGVASWDGVNADYQFLIDDWLGGPPSPPPLPPLPPIVAAAPEAPAINYGTPGSTGSGTGGSLDGDGRSVVTFDYAAFCSKPGSDGAPRSAGFVSACLSGAK